MAVIKKFFELDAIEQFGSIPSLRKALYDLERKRRDYEETGSQYMERHPKMLENAREFQQVKSALSVEVYNAIEDLNNKLKQLVVDQKEFEREMSGVQVKSKSLSQIEEELKNYERKLAVAAFPGYHHDRPTPYLLLLADHHRRHHAP